MALIFELGEEIERRVAGRSHHEGLQLVTPHGVAEQPDRVVDGEEDKQQIWKHQADRGDEARAPIGTRDARDRHPPSPPLLAHPNRPVPARPRRSGLALLHRRNPYVTASAGLPVGRLRPIFRLLTRKLQSQNLKVQGQGRA